jgi:hypothetical protein
LGYRRRVHSGRERYIGFVMDVYPEGVERKFISMTSGIPNWTALGLNSTTLKTVEQNPSPSEVALILPYTLVNFILVKLN